MKFEIVPLPLDEANAFVVAHHRHHGRVVGHRFSLAVADVDGNVRGVAIVGRPVSRNLDNGLTLEVTRVATDGAKDACSALYGACRRATFALGYKKLVTYTLAPVCPDCGAVVKPPVNGFSICEQCDATVIAVGESGVSLKAAGFKVVGEVRGRSWSCASRPRVDKHPTQAKLRWEAA